MEGFHTPSLSKHYGNPDCAAIKETHQLLTANAASINYDLGGGQNGYLGLILLLEQYACVSSTAFVILPDPGRTAQVPAYMPPTEEKHILSKHAEQLKLYDEYRTVDSALKNQLLAVFNDTYLATLNNDYTGYATRSTVDIIAHIYEQYTRISSMYTLANNERIRMT